MPNVLAMPVYLNLYTRVLVYLNLYTHALPKNTYLKIQDPIPKRTKANTSMYKTKISQDQNPRPLASGAKGKSARYAAAVAPAFYFLPSSRHWPEPSLSNTSGPVLEAKKTRHSVSQFHASWPPFFHAPQLCCEGYVQRDFFVHGSVFL